MKRIVIAGVAGGIVLFVWSFVSWMFIPWHQINQMPNESGIAKVLRDADIPAGAYWLPGMDHAALKAMTPEQRKAAEDAWMAAHEEGPVAMVMYAPEGSSPLSIMTLVIGFILEVVVAGIAAFLLAMAGPAIPSFVGRVLFVVLLGLFGAVGSHLMNWNYMNYPFRFAIEMSLDSLVMAVLLGIVLALLIRPESEFISDDFEVSAGV